MNKRQKLIRQQLLNNEKAVIDELEKVYREALRDINEKIKNINFTIDGLREEYDWLDPTDTKKSKVKSKIQSKIYQKRYQESLQSQLNGILGRLRESEFLTISDYLGVSYTDGFIGSIFDLHGQGVPFTIPIDQRSMIAAIQLQSKISEGLYTRLGVGIEDLKERIRAELSRSIATGASYDQVAQRLSGQLRIGYNNAIRIARTEGHRIQNSTTMDVARKAKERGANVVKQWDSTLDGRTRDTHIHLDGEIRELDEKFSNGLNYPGDPIGSAGEVINCRCTLLQRARWALGGSFTKRNNFTKELEAFNSPQEYDVFKKAFFSDKNRRYMDCVQRMQNKYETKNFEKILGSMSDREYTHYMGLLKNNPVYNKNASS